MKERKVNLEKFRTAETCNQVFKMQKKKNGRNSMGKMKQKVQK